MAHLYGYRGRRVRPLTPGERRQLAIAATATGLAVLPLAVAVVTAVSSGEHQLVVLLVRSATLLFVALKGAGGLIKV